VSRVVSRIGERLQEIWYGGRKPGLVLRALSALYGAVVRMRRAAYRRGWLRVQRVRVPVIVVGNITVGGSGKTPFVIALVEHLCVRGWSPGVVSRGYGRRSRGQVTVDVATSTEAGGDEPVLIARRCGVPVVVDADRVAAAKRVIALGCDIVVADDGLQHYRLHRDVEIEIVEAGRRLGNVRLLPAGPLREPYRDSTDLRIENGLDELSAEGQSPHFELTGDTLLAGDGRAQPLEKWRGQRVHAVAGIGNPQRFFRSLRDKNIDIVEHGFPDHHAYAEEDLHFLERLPIIMTEKDWVKCERLAPANTWYLPVYAACSPGIMDEIDRMLAAIMGDRRD